MSGWTRPMLPRLSTDGRCPGCGYVPNPATNWCPCEPAPNLQGYWWPRVGQELPPEEAAPEEPAPMWFAKPPLEDAVRREYAGDWAEPKRKKPPNPLCPRESLHYWGRRRCEAFCVAGGPACYGHLTDEERREWERGRVGKKQAEKEALRQRLLREDQERQRIAQEALARAAEHPHFWPLTPSTEDPLPSVIPFPVVDIITAVADERDVPWDYAARAVRRILDCPFPWLVDERGAKDRDTGMLDPLVVRVRRRGPISDRWPWPAN